MAGDMEELGLPFFSLGSIKLIMIASSATAGNHY
jgi:hypothetical protein